MQTAYEDKMKKNHRFFSLAGTFASDGGANVAKCIFIKVCFDVSGLRDLLRVLNISNELVPPHHSRTTEFSLFFCLRRLSLQMFFSLFLIIVLCLS